MNVSLLQATHINICIMIFYLPSLSILLKILIVLNTSLHLGHWKSLLSFLFLWSGIKYSLLHLGHITFSPFHIFFIIVLSNPVFTSHRNIKIFQLFYLVHKSFYFTSDFSTFIIMHIVSTIIIYNFCIYFISKFILAFYPVLRSLLSVWYK